MFVGTKRFRPLRQLGSGSMGFVYLVRDEELGSDVALKTLHSLGAEQLYELKSEFRTLAHVTHPNLVALYELFVEGENSFFTMEFVDGVNFIDYVRGDDHDEREDASCDIQRMVHAARQLGLGIAALHAASCVHRDIKPSNVLVDREGRAVVLDFGLARAWRSDEGLESTMPALAGTPAYMAPEQAWGTASPAADWYSVGILFYEALTGRRPFEGAAASVVYAKSHKIPARVRTLAPLVPEVLDGLVADLLQIEPSRRPGPDRLLSVLEEVGVGVATASDEPARAAPLEAFVDREAETARLQTLFARLADRQPTVLHVEGPSGIGKSELLRRFLATLERDHDATVLRARCHPCESVAYKALDGAVDMLSRWLLGLTDTRAALFVPRHTGALLRLFPVLGRVPVLAASGDDSEGGEAYDLRRRGFGAMREILARIADRERLVLWLDDFQWSDADSASLLRALLEASEPPAILLVLSYRSEDRASMPFLAAISEVARAAGIETERLIIGPLDPAATHGLAARLCSAHVSSEEQLSAIAAESSGSPLFVGELVRALLAKPDTGPATLAVGTLAPRLTDVINRRVRHLSLQARLILEVVCVAGHVLGRSVALNAAGIGEVGRPTLIALEQQRFVRTTTLRDRPAIEVYHDRIRETLIQTLPPMQLAAVHRRIGEALLDQPEADPLLLFEHFREAGERERAASYAAEAAPIAARALAFTRAADLYREALALASWSADETVELQTGLADALVNAGRGAAAAPVYVDAARLGKGSQAVELRRRAAEQFLVSGHIDEGTAELQALLKQLGLVYPRSTARAAIGLVRRLAQLRWRGTRFHPSPEADVSPTKLLAIDTCNAAAKGLVQVDPIRGTYFSALGLCLALETGETRRIGRDLCLGGSALMVAGGSMARWGSGMLDLADRLGAETSDPYLVGSTAVTRGVVAILDGRWADVLERCDQGLAILREQCRGVTWERAIGMMATIRALEELGRIPEALARMAEMRREAEEVGDVYAQVTARSYAAYWRLAADDPEGARNQVREALGLWTHRSYHLQHFYALRLEAYVDVYEGRPAEAWQRLEEAWPAVRRSGLLRHPVVAADAHLLRARVALAAAARAPHADAMLRTATRHTTALARSRRPDVVAHATALRAGIATTRGTRVEAIRLLRAAREQYLACGLALNHACMAWREVECVASDQSLTADAESVLAPLIRDRARWLDVHAPGFPVGA